MTRRDRVIRVAAVLPVGALAYMQWFVTTPGVITFVEWRVMLLVGAVALIVTLSSTWVSQGADRAETDSETYAESDNQRPIRPPWS